ncbi:MAG: ATP-binding protein [Acidobacteria bacterium]|jgi:hypothetical protein|nr:ATP-binding protein [Acidobacteriota bacterium]
MLGSDFRGLAEAVTQTYGEDPWFFLRELAQNSRDAGAHSIRVGAETSPAGMETLSFADDGRGMTLDHARRFLFRLFASDKGGDPSAAGRYGIGFWTILRFQPAAIVLQSRHGGESWAVALDSGLNARPVPCRLRRHGTTVELARAAQCRSPQEFNAQVEAGLLAYCRYLRRNDRRAALLPLWFAGRNLTEPMTLPGPLSLSFRSGPVEGAVGLGEKPEVRLFARGLPVWQGAVLGQMSHLQIDADVRSEVGAGLAPVFLLNGNHLDVTFSRNLAVENRALDLVRKKAEAALRRLLAASLETAFPRRWPQRLRDRLQAALVRMRRPGWRWIVPILLLLLPLEIVILRQWFPAGGGGAPPWFSLRAAPASYRGAVVNEAAAAAAPPFSYSPPGPRLFRLFVADVYDARSGFLRRASSRRRPLPATMPCPPSAFLSMSLRTGGGETLLPLAVGHELAAGSLRLAGQSLSPAYATVQGETVVMLPAGGGRIEYRSCPGRRQPELAAAEQARFSALPAAAILPAELEAAVSAARMAPVAERAAIAISLARQRLGYDTSAATVELYRNSRRESSWLSRVLRIGRGDCDVLNGFCVLLLRKMGVPARLVIGMVGEGGQARGRLHAWCEYFAGGWEAADATPVSAAVGPAPAPGHSPVAGPGPSVGPGGTDHRGSPRRQTALASFVLLALLTATVPVILLRRRRLAIAVNLPPAAEIKSPLLDIARQALLQPELWGTDNPLQHHRLLPALDGGPVSPRRAERLQRQKRLFVTANRNPLALAMAASGMTVLDLSQPPYAPWRTIFAGAVDCDMLCRLRPEPLSSGDGLLAAVNAILPRRQAVRLAPGLQAAEMLRVSLPVALRNGPFYFPRRFIAVAPQGRMFSRAAAQYALNPALATIRFLRHLHEDGILDRSEAPGRLRKAARRLLRRTYG